MIFKDEKEVWKFVEAKANSILNSTENTLDEKGKKSGEENCNEDETLIQNKSNSGDCEEVLYCFPIAIKSCRTKEVESHQKVLHSRGCYGFVFRNDRHTNQKTNKVQRRRKTK